MTKYLIAIGSNLNSKENTRLEIIEKALIYFPSFDMLLIKASSFWESKSFSEKNQPNFINAVIEVFSELKPFEVLTNLKKIEKLFGRRETKRWGDRVLDLDIIGCESIVLPSEVVFMKWFKMPYDLQIIIQPDVLILPHPRIQDRLFVLKPLEEIKPEWVHPVLQMKPKELIDCKNWKKAHFLKLVK